MSGTTVLLVEDEPDIREMLCFSLEKEGYNVLEAASAEQALERIYSYLPNILLVDWMLPGMSGIELVRRLRGDDITKNIPVIMLTARCDETDKLKGFEIGIDDYVNKPFSPKELAARMKAVLRRSNVDNDEILCISNLSLDTCAHRLTINDQQIHIGPTEFKLLEFFLRNPERVYSREQLLDRVWGRNIYVEERTVDVHILRLRKLLTPYNYDNIIQTVRGTGYRLSKFSHEK